MKKVFLMALMVVGMTTFAQDKAPKGERAEMERLTPEQKSQLHLKELTLKLDLSASQQSEIKKILADADAKREAAKAAYKTKKEKGQKLTANERFELQNKILDEKIAMKEKMKKVLSEDQMAKWEKFQQDRKAGTKHIRKDREKSEKPERK